MLIPDKCIKCKLNSDELLKKYKDCSQCEPLINKTRIAINVKANQRFANGKSDDFPKNKPLVFLKDDVKFAFNFYKKYEYYQAMLRDNEKDAWEDWLKSDYYKISIAEIKSKYPNLAYESYRDWLLEYSFKDVI